MRKNKHMTIEDFLTAGVYYRILKDISNRLLVHLSNNIFTKAEMKPFYTLYDQLHALETKMGFERSLAEFIKENPDDEAVQEVSKYFSSVFYGSIDQNRNFVDKYFKGFCQGMRIRLPGDTPPDISKEKLYVVSGEILGTIDETPQNIKKV